MKTTTALLLVAAAAGCDGPASSVDAPITPHVFEALVAALDIKGPVGVYESWDNIPDPDLAAELKEYAEGAELVKECGSWHCTGPYHPVSIKFREWTWGGSPPPPDPSLLVEDPLGGYAWGKAIESFGPIMRDGRGVVVEIEWLDCMCGSIMAVEVTRTDEGGWLVGKVAGIGTAM